eukprot:gb/GECG01012344.1/.p1 GENE.gb/GECG01012344.1/~~gb/GECG01012344.1/.p1  ORF type:complete len:163 (+),score=16.96 gb/GECG01012344.1/:1-489(+)
MRGEQAVLFGCAVLAAQLTAVSADDLPSDLQKWWHYDSQGICTSYDLTNPKEKVSLCATKISGESSSCSTYKTSNVTKVVPRPWYRVDFDKSCIFIKDGSPVKGADTEGYFCRHPIPWTSVVNLQEGNCSSSTGQLDLHDLPGDLKYGKTPDCKSITAYRIT